MEGTYMELHIYVIIHICIYALYIYLNITHIYVYYFKRNKRQRHEKQGKNNYGNTRANTVIIIEYSICPELLGNQCGQKEKYWLCNPCYHKILSLQVLQERSS